MILPKNKVYMLQRAVHEYMDRHACTKEELEYMCQVYDKCSLAIQGDATGLDIEQIYYHKPAKDNRTCTVPIRL